MNNADISDVVTALAPAGTTSVIITPVTAPEEIDQVLGGFIDPYIPKVQP